MNTLIIHHKGIKYFKIFNFMYSENSFIVFHVFLFSIRSNLQFIKFVIFFKNQFSMIKSIQELPFEVLVHIFKFLPNRWNISIVCSEFYDVVCAIERNKFSLKLIDVS